MHLVSFEPTTLTSTISYGKGGGGGGGRDIWEAIVMQNKPELCNKKNK